MLRLFGLLALDDGGQLRIAQRAQVIGLGGLLTALNPFAAQLGNRGDRFTPIAEMCGARSPCPLRANSGLMRCGKLLYSITVSTRASSVGGTVMPSDFAVFILRLKSSFVDCSTGSSPGFSPFKIRST